MKKVLIVGPLPYPVSGVSLANLIVKQLLENEKGFSVKEINTSYNKFEESLGKFSIKKSIHFVLINLKAFNVFGSDIVYITPGQTFFGVIKYTLFILIAFLTKKQLVIHIHGDYLHKEYQQLKGVKKLFFKFLLSKASKGIVLSESLIRNMSPFIPKENIYILKNFAEDFLMDNNIEKDYSSLKIVFLSNLMKEKGINDLLESLEMLEKNNIQYEARIAGNIDIVNKDSVNKKINSLVNAKYLGIVSGKEKLDLLHWSNVFVLPTYYSMEGQPISIIEAMASGNVIVTTKHAGIPDIVKNLQNGFFVEKRNPKSIYESFINIINNVDMESMANYNRSYFLENFTLESFKNKLIKILNE